LKSLQKTTCSDCEIIVVDNASEDGTRNMLQREFPGIRCLALPENLGFAEGCNRGIAVAKGEWIATLNQDTLLDSQWLVEMQTQIKDSSQDLGMLQPRMLFMEEPERINSKGIALTASGFGIDRGFREPVGAGDRVEEIFCPTAGAALYRKSMLDGVRLQTGYFDRHFFMYGEDLDLGWRCRLAGWKALYVPMATVYHHYQGSVVKKTKQYADAQIHKNRVRSLLKNGSLKMIFRNLNHVMYDFLLGFKYNGTHAAGNFISAVQSGLNQRPAVTSLVQIKRTSLEKRWIT